MSNLILSSSPERGVVRIGGAAYSPFEPRTWQFDQSTGRVKNLPRNRFDDIGPALGLPRSNWFQSTYAATHAEAAYGELLASRRLSGRGIEAVAELANRMAEALTIAAVRSDPKFPTQGTVPADWRQSKLMFSAVIDPSARFVDLAHPSTLTYLLSNFVPHLRELIPSLVLDDDFDLSDVMSRNRVLTQHLARYLHELPRDAVAEISDGEEIAGIRYLSRHSPEWECWAIFADRVEGKLEIGESRAIAADDPDLLAVARHFGLSVETDTPGDYLRPWLED